METSTGRPLIFFLGLSLLAHIALILFSNDLFGLSNPPEISVESVSESVDVVFLTEIRPPAPQPEPVPVEAEEPEVQELTEEAAPVETSEKPVAPPSDPAQGALTEAKPDYLQNAAPVYPWEARRHGWEGVVILSVDVNRQGRATRCSLLQSSGHTVLDQAALKTVRTWRFKPGRIGNQPVESSVQVPIRFTLQTAQTG